MTFVWNNLAYWFIPISILFLFLKRRTSHVSYSFYHLFIMLVFDIGLLLIKLDWSLSDESNSWSFLYKMANIWILTFLAFSTIEEIILKQYIWIVHHIIFFLLICFDVGCAAYPHFAWIGLVSEMSTPLYILLETPHVIPAGSRLRTVLSYLFVCIFISIRVFYCSVWCPIIITQMVFYPSVSDSWTCNETWHNTKYILLWLTYAICIMQLIMSVLLVKRLKKYKTL